jgi:hypothetical protein
MKSKLAQIAIEFIIIMGAAMFFLAVLFLAIQNNTEDKVYIRENIIVKEIALTVKNEIDLATESINGYVRNFEIPEKAGNLDYEIILDNNNVYIKTNNNKHAMSFPISNVTGQINITNNIIRKNNGIVYLNQ